MDIDAPQFGKFALRGGYIPRAKIRAQMNQLRKLTKWQPSTQNFVTLLKFYLDPQY